MMSGTVKKSREYMASASQNALAPRMMVLSTSKNAASCRAGAVSPAFGSGDGRCELFDETGITPPYCLIKWRRHDKRNEWSPHPLIRSNGVFAVRRCPRSGERDVCRIQHDL